MAEDRILSETSRVVAGPWGEAPDQRPGSAAWGPAVDAFRGTVRAALRDFAAKTSGKAKAPSPADATRTPPGREPRLAAFTLDGKIHWISKRICRLAGYRREDLLGTDSVLLLPPARREESRAGLRAGVQAYRVVEMLCADGRHALRIPRRAVVRKGRVAMVVTYLAGAIEKVAVAVAVAIAA